MASIVYRTNKKNGVVYAFRSESYRDPVTKQPKSRRTYLGRVDPVTKEIIPKAEDGKRNRSKLGESSDEAEERGTSSSNGVPADIIAQLNHRLRKYLVIQLQYICRASFFKSPDMSTPIS